MEKKIIAAIMGVCLVLTSVSCSLGSKNIHIANAWKCAKGQHIYHVYTIGRTDDLFVSYFEDNKKGEQDRRTARIDKNGKEIWKFTSDRAPEFSGNEFVFDDPVTRKTSYFDPISGKTRKTIDGKYLQSDIFGKLNLYETTTTPKKLVRLDESGKAMWQHDIGNDIYLENTILVDNKLVLIDQSSMMVVCPWRPTDTNNEVSNNQKYDTSLSYVDIDLTITILDYLTGKQIMKSTYPVKDSGHFEINSNGLLPYYLKVETKDKLFIVINDMTKAIDCLTGKTMWESKEKRHFAEWFDKESMICACTGYYGQNVSLLDVSTGKTIKSSKKLDGQITHHRTYKNTIVGEFDYPPGNKLSGNMKTVGLDIKTLNVKWDKDVYWNDHIYYDHSINFSVDDDSGNSVNCIAVKNIGSKTKEILFISIDSGETLATFDNIDDLCIEAIIPYEKSISIVCDRGIVVGNIDRKTKKFTTIHQLVFKDERLLSTYSSDAQNSFVFNDMAVYADNKNTYIYDIRTLDKVFEAKDMPISNYDYDGKSIIGWAGDKYIKIDLQ